MPEREPAELAARLASKANDDATAVREFAANPQIADSIIGFHAQQAVEKWLKAAMALSRLPQTRIHDIDRLAEILEEGGVELPLNRECGSRRCPSGSYNAVGTVIAARHQLQPTSAATTICAND